MNRPRLLQAPHDAGGAPQAHARDAVDVPVDEYVAGESSGGQQILAVARRRSSFCARARLTRYSALRR